MRHQQTWNSSLSLSSSFATQNQDFTIQPFVSVQCDSKYYLCFQIFRDVWLNVWIGRYSYFFSSSKYAPFSVFLGSFPNKRMYSSRSAWILHYFFSTQSPSIKVHKWIPDPLLWSVCPCPYFLLRLAVPCLVIVERKNLRLKTSFPVSLVRLVQSRKWITNVQTMVSILDCKNMLRTHEGK